MLFRVDYGYPFFGRNDVLTVCETQALASVFAVFEVKDFVTVGSFRPDVGQEQFSDSCRP